MKWVFALPWAEITIAAGEACLDRLLVASIVMTESSGKAWAKKYEPEYRWLYKPEHYATLLNRPIEVEREEQMTSWGLMQVMGAVAREHGFADALPGLCDKMLGLRYGCLH